MVTNRRMDETRLAYYLVERIVNQLNGRAEDVCLNDRPRNRYFIGSLANQPDKADNYSDTPDDDLFSRLAPSAMGLDILVRRESNQAKLLITCKFAVYYRVYPSLEQQRKISGVEGVPTGGINLGTETVQKDSEWAIAYKKLPVVIDPIEVVLPADIPGMRRLDTSIAQQILTDSLGKAKKRVIEDPLHFRKPKDKKSVPISSLSNHDTYINFIQQPTRDSEECLPEWNAQLQITARPDRDGMIRISILLNNNSPEDRDERECTDHYFFDVQIHVTGINARIEPFVFDILPEDYQYNRELWGLGRNCSVKRVDQSNAVETENTPIFKQPVYTTRDAVDPTAPKARFIELAQDPIPVLESILSAMDRYAAEWEKRIDRRDMKIAWNPETEIIARNDLSVFQEEIERYRRGINSLKQYNLLNQAFRLMNQTFANASNYDSWRLFQIVYIVTQLPGITAREYNDIEGRADWDYVDVLWFPTGGGKTEAYLGLIVCTAFFDRLRGKKAGVSAWMKFPLRLLSLQQLQRLADILGAAELIRRATPVINDSGHDPFSVAYLVGSGNTPNRLTEYQQGGRVSWLERFQQNPDLLQKFLTIPRCPFCKEPTVVMSLDIQVIRLVHKCTNPKCPSVDQGGVLPIFIVDNEIYRYLPTVIAGTIDKITAIGYERKFSHLYGAVTHRCPVHGYLSLGECTEKYAPCNTPRNYVPVTLKDPSPTLQIQDELHLLREELGAFDGHYETFVDTYQKKRQNVKTKIIAATATIEEYENQISHLYDKKARRFPAPGPAIGESFYAVTLSDDIRRLFVGVMPHNYTHINAVIRIAELFHREIETLRLNPQEAIRLLKLSSISTSEEFLSMLSYYEVFVTYLLSKREGDRLNQSFEGQLNRELTDAGYSEVRNESIIGETPFPQVAEILKELEKPAPEFGNRIRSITATSTISHGVDVERINFMCFFGMPRQTAEYIQTSSRAGRDHPGMVFICFNPARERDQSHYHYFAKYHEYLDRLVEPVPINRWSKFSIRRTIPGLFMAILLNDYNLSIGGAKQSLYFANTVRDLIEKQKIRPDEMISYLNDAYRTGGRDSGREFEIQINDKVTTYLNLLRNPQESFTSGNLTEQPMQSLRDIDEQLAIRLNVESGTLFSNIYRRRQK